MVDLSIAGERVGDTKQDWPRDGLESVPRCPACGSNRRRLLYSEMTDRVFFCAPGRWKLYTCEACRSAYLDPRPSPASIGLAYQTYYTHSRKQRQETEALRGLRRFVRALANGYRNHRYGSDFRPASRFGRVLIPMLLPYRRALDGELRYLPPFRPGARLLDVGFGNAAFLDIARRVGWRVAGVDPDPKVVEVAQREGFEVFEGGIEAIAGTVGEFDAITLNHVIEHVHEPLFVLRQAFSLLKPGGCLYVDTPNVEAAGHRKYREHWRGLEVPRHLVLFSAGALRALLSEAGFGTIEQHCHSEILSGLSGSSQAIAEGRDPYDPRPSSLSRLARSALSEVATIFDKSQSEFITLMAHKPVEEGAVR